MVDFPPTAEPAYLINDDQLEVLVAVDGVLHRPTPEERESLNAYFANPYTRNPSNGRYWTLLGVDVPGVEGAVVTYVVRPGPFEADAGPNSSPEGPRDG